MKYDFQPAVITVDYDEIDPSPVADGDASVVSITKTYRCAWALRWELYRQLMGRDQYPTNSAAPSIVVIQPHALHFQTPQKQHVTWVFCQKVAVKPFTGQSDGGAPAPVARESLPVGEGVSTHEYAELTATYDDGPWFVTERFSIGGEVIAIQGSKEEQLYWKSDGAKVDKQTTRPMVQNSTAVWTVSFPGLAFMHENMFTLRNFVNDHEMISQRIRTVTDTGHTEFRKFAAGTVLYMGAEVIEASGPAARQDKPFLDTPYLGVDLTLQINESGWNNFFRPLAGATGTWDSLCKDAACTVNYNPHAAGDLRTVIGAEI
jgi:hypothetical protein